MGRTENKFLVSENTIMWAFRYALGRKTGAVDDVCMTLKNHWKDLEIETQIQIKDEIREAIRTDRAGMDCDVRGWGEILELDGLEECHHSSLGSASTLVDGRCKVCGKTTKEMDDLIHGY